MTEETKKKNCGGEGLRVSQGGRKGKIRNKNRGKERGKVEDKPDTAIFADIPYIYAADNDKPILG